MVGPAFWSGKIGENSRPGPGVALGIGFELFSWLSVEASWLTSIHLTNRPYPPSRDSFSTHAFHGGIRFVLPLGRFDLYLRGGAGGWFGVPDVLVHIKGLKQELRFSWLGGLGVLYHTLRKRFWIGLAGDVVGTHDRDDMLFMAALMLGCTF